MTTKQNETDYRNSPIVWFFSLETARHKNDFERAAQAVRELKRLGVVVKFKGSTGKKLTEAERTLSNRRPTILGTGEQQR